MARSIGDWYADHADNSDGNPDDEYLERQPAWDIARSDRQIVRTAKQRRRAPKPSRVPAPSTKGLTKHQAKVRAEVLAMRRRFPRDSYKQLVQRLQARGITVGRRDVAAILTQPSRADRSAQQRRVRAEAVRASQRDLREQRSAAQPRRSTSRIPSRKPDWLPPDSLTLDGPPQRRRTMKTAWRGTEASAVRRTTPPEPVVPCKACGVVPAASGLCRCS